MPCRVWPTARAPAVAPRHPFDQNAASGLRAPASARCWRSGPPRRRCCGWRRPGRSHWSPGLVVTWGARRIDQPVGLGYTSAAIEGVAPEALWEAMLAKTGHGIVEYLPVVDVEVEESSGAAPGAPCGSWAPGHWPDSCYASHIYAEEPAGEIRFVSLDDQGRETDTEVVNAMLRDPLRIEYFWAPRRLAGAGPLARAEVAHRGRRRANGCLGSRRVGQNSEPRGAGPHKGYDVPTYRSYWAGWP
ncbi:unnamed protein product [Prorocentrum cordatum]|uniref:Beta-ketoacyl synthase N-terminal domain-containing protein n=1 Tax=Prorocentrum cordatum TaxID=2364126 RepID=A0ABN9XDM8_9DINO|nr:unnamed protein product [Polarella glacialis]